MSTQAVTPFKNRVMAVRDMFAARKNQMAKVLPSYLTSERLVTLAMAAAQNTPKLLECDPLSFVNAVVQAGRLGLEPDGLLGHSYLVPFKGKVTLVAGYKGLLKLARNSGQLSTIQAHAVHANDRFTFAYGLDPKLEHTPTAEEPGEIVAFYAVARLKDGSSQFEVMWRRQVDKIRNDSQGYQAAKKFNSVSPWDSHYEEMGKKTVLRRLCKMLPASVELQKAVALDEQAEAGLGQEFDIFDVPADDVSGENGKSKLDAVVDAAKAQQPQEPPKPEAPATTPAAPKSTTRGKQEAKAAAPAQQPKYSDTEPDPFAPGGDLFGRDPGQEG